MLALPEGALVVDIGDRRDSPGKEFVYVTPGGVFAHRWTGKGWGGAAAWAEGETCLRRGKGTPLVRDFSLLEAQQLSYRIAILQSSPAGYNVYRKLGFQHICQMEDYFWSELA